MANEISFEEFNAKYAPKQQDTEISFDDFNAKYAQEKQANNKEQDYPLTRGYVASKASVSLAESLATHNYDEAAKNIAEQARYAKANPGSEESVGLQKAWKKGDGILGGIANVAGEIASDYQKADGAIAGAKSLAGNAQAMGSGIVAQIPNMVLPMAGMVGGGLAGSTVAPVIGTILGAWSGASTGNALVGTSEAAMRQLKKAGINPEDTEAVKTYLQKNSGSILGETSVKGGVIGAVDTATMGLTHFILTGPGKAAADRALAKLGVDTTDHAAVSAAAKTPQFKSMVASDPVYIASKKGAGNAARNIGAASLEPVGEFTGEYAGSKIATGEADAKDAFLEAASSLGQSGATFAGQKLYAGAKYPFQSGTTPPPNTSPPGSPPPPDIASSSNVDELISATKSSIDVELDNQTNQDLLDEISASNNATSSNAPVDQSYVPQPDTEPRPPINIAPDVQPLVDNPAGSDGTGVLRYDATIGTGELGLPGTVVEVNGARGVSANGSNQQNGVDGGINDTQTEVKADGVKRIQSAQSQMAGTSLAGLQASIELPKDGVNDPGIRNFQLANMAETTSNTLQPVAARNDEFRPFRTEILKYKGEGKTVTGTKTIYDATDRLKAIAEDTGETSLKAQQVWFNSKRKTLEKNGDAEAAALFERIVAQLKERINTAQEPAPVKIDDQVATVATDVAEKMAEVVAPKPKRKVGIPKRMSLLEWVASEGGFNRAEIAAEIGRIDDLKAHRSGILRSPSFRAKGGKSWDDLGRDLSDAGYLPKDEHGKYDKHDLFQRIDAELAGEKQYTLDDIEAIAETDKVARELDELRTEAESVGVDWKRYKTIDDLWLAIDAKRFELSDAAEAIAEEVLSRDDVDTDFDFGTPVSAAETEAWLNGVDNGQGHQGQANGTPARDAGEDDQRDTERGSAQGEAEQQAATGEFALTSQTEEDLRQQEARAADTSIDDREAADRASEVPLTLSAQSGSNTGSAANQGSMFTPDGRASKAADQTASKEPWQMTQAEWLEHFSPEVKEKRYGWNVKATKNFNVDEHMGSALPSVGNATPDIMGHPMRVTASMAKKLSHKALIAASMTQGKPVPAEVLADYPDLRPTQEAKPQLESKPADPIDRVTALVETLTKSVQALVENQNKPETKPEQAAKPTGTWYVDATERQQEVLDSLPRITSFDGLEFRKDTKDDANEVGQATFDSHEMAPGIRRMSLDGFALTGYNNAKDTERIDRLATAIKESGEITPLIASVSPNGEINVEEGQHRARALRKLGYDSVPVRVIVAMDGTQAEYDADTDAQIKAKEIKSDVSKKAENVDTSKERVKGIDISKNKVFTDDAAAAARAILKKKLGQLNSGLDPEMMQAGITLAGYHIEKGARTFATFARAMIDDLGDAVKPYLKSWYAAIKFDQRAAEFSSSMDSMSEIEAADVNALTGENNVTDEYSGTDLERDSENADPEDSLGEESVSDGRRGNVEPGKQGVPGTQEEGGAGSRIGLSGREAATDGERGNLAIYTGATGRGTEDSIAGDSLDQRSNNAGIEGSPIESDAASVTQDVSESGLQLGADKLKQKAADRKEHTRTLENIRLTLPILTEGQQEDVFKAETRFAKEDGYGMLFTNGTGTGKTFTGLGVIKRFFTEGKRNIIIAVPNDKIASDWQKAGTMLGLDISRLEDTNSAGEGVVITTYANYGQNNQLAHRNWDLIVHDEAHYLAMDKDGTNTLALHALRALSLHPDGVSTRHSMLYADDIARLTELQTKLKDDENNASLKAELNKAEIQHRETREKVKNEVADNQGNKRPRALFLSATPFAYVKTVDWANGYLFDYDEGRSKDTSRSYNTGSNANQFFMQHFGYSMRYNRLTQPDAKVDTGLMQRQFNSYLKKNGVLSGRMLDVKADYDRRFVLVDSAVGVQIDAALQWFEEERKANKGNEDKLLAIGKVAEVIAEKFDYLSRRYLLESIKAKEVLPHVREHLAMGRKVVVFHDYKKGGGFNPFDLEHRNSDDSAAFNEVVDSFRSKFKSLIQSDVWHSSSPITTFQREFPDVLLFNGEISPKQRRANVEKFQDDASGPQVFLVQSQAGKEGISLHDTTGKHQRVLFNLGQPTQPTTAIQQEGRIYRTGQVTDAIFRYLNTGTNWEKWAFATTASRSSAAENLGMGEHARALKDAFIEAFEESDSNRAGMEGEGKGGKERDQAANNALTEYDRARAFYFGTQKKNSRSKSQEGTDYFATPEPVGLTMVQLADIRIGESVLEPSAGHGSIARWMPENAERTAVEPSMSLRPRLAMVFDGKIVDTNFEDLHVSNKYDAIIMNPPFGSAGRTAVDHIAKAATHLRNGGRIVALMPVGSATTKFDKWFYEMEERPVKPLATHPTLGPIYKGDTISSKLAGADDVIAKSAEHGGIMFGLRGSSFSTLTSMEGIYDVKPTGKRTTEFSPAEGLQLVAEIKLPQVTFERAGTAVSTRIIVIEKSGDTKQFVDRDYSDITDINELFDRMENLSIPQRTKAQTDVEPVATQKVSKPVVDKVAAKEAADAAGLEIIEHTTSKGKVIRGVVRADLTLNQAKEIDKFTFKKNGGYFIREKHLAANNDDPLFSKSTTTQNTHTVASATSAMLEAHTGKIKSVLQAMLDNGKAKVVTAEQAAEVVGEDALYMTAWHGSPHDHDGFSMDKVGTGEGAQAFGHGLYFAGARAVAEYYQNILTKRDPIKLKGVEPKNEIEEMAVGRVNDRIRYGVVSAEKAIKEVILNARNLGGANDPSYVAREKAIASYLEDLWDSKPITDRNKGKLYQVELAPSQDDYLLWDKPLSEQSEKVKAALKNVQSLIATLPDKNGPVNRARDAVATGRGSGEQLYNRLLEHFKKPEPKPSWTSVSVDTDGKAWSGQKAASEYLHSLGIRGIKYLDGSSRSAGDGNFNYVIFNDQDVKITAKFAKEGQALAFYNPNDSITYFVADHIPEGYTPKEWKGLVLHEIATHALQLGRDTKEFKSILNQIELMRKAGNKAVVAAFKRVPKDTRPENVTEEAMAYLLQDSSGLGIVQRFIAWFRNAIRAIGKSFPTLQKLKLHDWALKLSESDLRFMAESALKNAEPSGVQNESDTPQFSKSSQTSTEAFKKWFGGSKIVNADGTPKIVYHFTDARDIAAFDMGKLGEATIDNSDSKQAYRMAELGFWFTNKDISHPPNGVKAQDVDGGFMYSEVGYPVFLSIKNPRRFHTFDSMWKAAESFRSGEKWRASLVSQGYDGAVVLNDTEFAARSYIAFNPNQIKSATGNNGNFDGSNNNILFSKQSNPIARSPVNAGKPLDSWIKIFTRNQIVTLYRDSLIGKKLEEYKELRERVTADTNSLFEKADNFLLELRQIPKGLRDAFASLAHDSTLNNVDPSNPKYVPSPDAVKLADYLADNPTNKRLAAKIKKRLNSMEAAHKKLHAEFSALPTKEQELFKELRSKYTEQMKTVFDELKKRIGRTKNVDPAIKISSIKKLDEQLADLLGRVYFPLYRAGNYIVKAEKAGEPTTVDHVESNFAADRLEKKLKKLGYTVSRSTRIVSPQNNKSNKALNAVRDLLDKAALGGKIEGAALSQLIDDIDQTVIQSLPDQSYRKSFIHRKGTKGYSDDFIRAYADAMRRGSINIANLRHGDKITTVIEDMRKDVKDASKVPGSNVAALNQVVDRVEQIEVDIRNPTSKLVSVSGKIAFAQMLGSLSNFILNITQTPLLTMPHLGAEYGYGKANLQLAMAYAKQMRSLKKQGTLSELGKWLDMRHGLVGNELDLMQQLHDSGALDLTQSFDLIDAANNPSYQENELSMNFMKVIALPQHVSEIVNRQVTALATIRLEMARSGSPLKAYHAARKAIDQTHFDYSKENRAKLMTGNTQSILFRFKQYAQQAAFLFVHTAKLALNGSTNLDSDGNKLDGTRPSERTKARKQLAGVLGMQILVAGTLGLPVFAEAAVAASGVAGFKLAGSTGAYVGVAGAMIIAAALAFGDDDGEEFDVEVKKWFIQHFGKDIGSSLADGIIPRGLASRLNASELVIRRPKEARNSTDFANQWMISLLGAFWGGTVYNAGVGLKDIVEGDTAKGATKLIPVKAIKDLVTSWKWANDGMNVTNKDGEIITPVSKADIFFKSIGINPTSVVNAREYDNAKFTLHNALLKKQQKALKELREETDKTKRFNAIIKYNKSAPLGYEIDSDKVRGVIAREIKYKGKPNVVTGNPVQEDYLNKNTRELRPAY